MNQFKQLCQHALAVYEGMQNSRYLSLFRSTNAEKKSPLQTIIATIPETDTFEAPMMSGISTALTALSKQYQTESPGSKLAYIVNVLARTIRVIVGDEQEEHTFNGFKELEQSIKQQCITSNFFRADPEFAANFSSLIQAAQAFIVTTNRQNALTHSIMRLDYNQEAMFVLQERNLQIQDELNDLSKSVEPADIDIERAKLLAEVSTLNEQMQQMQNNGAKLTLNIREQHQAIAKLQAEQKQKEERHKTIAQEHETSMEQKRVLEIMLNQKNQELSEVKLQLTSVQNELNQLQANYLQFKNEREVEAVQNHQVLAALKEWLINDCGQKSFTVFYELIQTLDKTGSCGWVDVCYHRYKDIYRDVYAPRPAPVKEPQENKLSASEIEYQQLLAAKHKQGIDDINAHFEHTADVKVRRFNNLEAVQRQCTTVMGKIDQVQDPLQRQFIEKVNETTGLAQAEYQFAKALMARISDIRTGKIERLDKHAGEFIRRNVPYFQAKIAAEMQKVAAPSVVAAPALPR